MELASHVRSTLHLAGNTDVVVAIDCVVAHLLLGEASPGQTGSGWIVGMRDFVARYPSKSMLVTTLPGEYVTTVATLVIALRAVQHSVGGDPRHVTEVLDGFEPTPGDRVTLSWCLRRANAIIDVFDAAMHRDEAADAAVFGFVESVADWCLGGEVDPADVETLVTQVRRLLAWALPAL